MIQSFKMAMKSIASNKMRSFLTILGIVIGVVAIVVLVAIAQGTNAQVTSNIENMGTNLLTVNIRTNRENPLTLDMLQEFCEDEAISAASPMITQTGTAKAGIVSYEDGTIQGVSPSYLEIRGLSLLSGRFITQPDMDNRSYVSVLGAEAATEMFGTLSCVGETFTINGYRFTVVGVLKEKGSTSSGSSDNQIILPFTLAQRLYQQSSITNFYVSASSAQQVTAAEYAVTDKLYTLFNQDSDSYNVYNQTDMLETLSDTTQTLTLMLGGIAAISLLVGGIGIMNIMLVSVSERTREIGIRKAIGAARKNILLQFLIEAFAVSLIGGILGLILSFVGILFIGPALSMNLTVSPFIALIAIGFSIVIGVIFGLYPANKASKPPPHRSSSLRWVNHKQQAPIHGACCLFLKIYCAYCKFLL